MRPAVVVPAFEAAGTERLDDASHRAAVPRDVPIIVVDDGSTDETARIAEAKGAHVVSHPKNFGKGAALLTGFRAAHGLGCDTALTVDADGQHPTEEALRVLGSRASAHALVLGVRDLRADGAPRANAIGNAISNFFLSLFSWRRLVDTQCGLRRYPILPVLTVAPRDKRFGFESEVILRVAWRRVPIVEVPVRALYPPKGCRRITHYRAWLDSFRIGLRITITVLSQPFVPLFSRMDEGMSVAVSGYDPMASQAPLHARAKAMGATASEKTRPTGDAIPSSTSMPTMQRPAEMADSRTLSAALARATK
jgi:glycosyltransferase involved in cell wall biosynthesis